MRIYRLDTFTVPDAVLAEFVDRVRETHALLRQQPGFVRDLILEEPEPAGTTRFATMVEWEDEASKRKAADAVRGLRRTTGFDPGAFIAQRGISATFGEYRASTR